MQPEGAWGPPKSLANWSEIQVAWDYLSLQSEMSSVIFGGEGAVPLTCDSLPNSM